MTDTKSKPLSLYDIAYQNPPPMSGGFSDRKTAADVEAQRVAEDGEQGFGGDAADAFQMGAGQSAAGMAETVYQITGSETAGKLRDATQNWAEGQIDQMSDSGREAMGKQFFSEDENGDVQFGEAWSDPESIGLQFSNMAGQLAGQVVTGFGFTGAVAKVGAKVVTKNLIKRGLAKGMTKEAAQEYAKSMIRSGAGVTGQALAGAGITGGQMGIQVRDEILNLSDEELGESNEFRILFHGKYKATYPDATNRQLIDMAKKELAERTATAVQADPLTITANLTLDAIGGRYIDNLIRGVGTGKRLTNAGMQAIGQGIPEAAQGGMEQFNINRAMVNEGVDTDRDLMEGVATNALNEGVLGAGMGGAMGALTKGTPREKPSIQEQTSELTEGEPAQEENTQESYAQVQAMSPLEQAVEQIKAERGQYRGIDDDIRIAEQQGFEDEAVRLRAAKRNFQMAEEFANEGDTESAKRFNERALKIYREVTQMGQRDAEASEPKSQLPAEYVAIGEYLERTQLPEVTMERDGETYDEVEGLKPEVSDYDPDPSTLIPDSVDAPYYMGTTEEAKAARQQTERAMTEQQGQDPGNAPARMRPEDIEEIPVDEITIDQEPVPPVVDVEELPGPDAPIEFENQELDQSGLAIQDYEPERGIDFNSADRTNDLADRVKDQIRKHKLPKGLDDGRLLRSYFRSGLENMAGDLVSGGGVTYVRDSNDKIIKRTPSQNPKWFQDAPDNVKRLGVKGLKKTIDQALKGRPLGRGQARAVRYALDHITENRNEYARTQARPEREDLVKFRKVMRGEMTPQEAGFADSDPVPQRYSDAIKRIASSGDQRFTDTDYEAVPGGNGVGHALADDIREALDSGLPENVVTEVAKQFGDDPVEFSLRLFVATEAHKNGQEITPASIVRAANQRALEKESADRGEEPEWVKGESEPEAEEELLTSYTEEDLRQKEADRQQAEKVSSETELKAQQKAKADAEVDSFALTGSYAEADQAAAVGQSDLLQEARNNSPDNPESSKGNEPEKTPAPAGVSRSRDSKKASEPKSKPAPKPTSDLPEILTATRKSYLKKMARKEGLKPSSPGYESAMQRIEDQYETDVDRAQVALSFEQFNELNSDSPEGVNRQAWESLRKEYGEPPGLEDNSDISAADKEFNFSAVIRGKDGSPFHVNSRRGRRANVAPFKNGRPEIHSSNETVDLDEYKFSDEWWSNGGIVSGLENSFGNNRQNENNKKPIIRNSAGNPYKNKGAARKALKKHPGYELVEVEGGFELHPVPEGAAEAGNSDIADAPRASATEVNDDFGPDVEVDSAPSTPDSDIDDVGEKLGGARKDELRTTTERLSDLDDQGIADSTLSQLFPKGEINKIEDVKQAALYKVVRDEIPNKPRVRGRLKRWVDSVKSVRELLELASGEGAESLISVMREKGGALRNLADKVELLSAVDRKQWDRIKRVSRASGKYRDESGEMIPGSWYDVEIDGKRKAFYGMESVSDLTAPVSEYLGEPATKERSMKFEVRSSGGGKKFYINKKGDRERRALKTFDTLGEARSYIIDGYDDLVNAWESVKARDNVSKADTRGSKNKARVGEDWRSGKDVSPQEFIERFSIRGAEFGNWVKQGKGGRERQGLINAAYDAFMDLADTLNIPPEAIGLGGQLGIGFGSRGRGGRAAAHYEPWSMVINLTKTQGSGSLAHEWFHALDNYFWRKRGQEPAKGQGNYITFRPEPMMVNKKIRGARLTKFELERYQKNYGNNGDFADSEWERDKSHPEGVRPEVEKKFADLASVLNSSPVRQRSLKIDSKPNAYWSQIIELAARSFENYVIASLAKKGNRNDFLANVTPESEFARDAERYPYLRESELLPVEKAFDEIFETIEARKDGDKTILASLSDDVSAEIRSLASQFSGKSRVQTRSTAKQVRGWLEDMAEGMDSVEVVETSLDLPGRVKIDLGAYFDSADGAYDIKTGKTYIVAGNIRDQYHAKRVFLHEVVGHGGVINYLKQNEKLGGKAYLEMLDDIYYRAGHSVINKDIDRYAFDYDNPDERRIAVLEYIAHLAEKGKKMGLVQRVIAALRDLIRRFNPDIDWTDTDTLALIEKGRRHLRENGSSGQDGGTLARLSDDLAEDSSLNDAEKAALSKIGPKGPVETAAEKVRGVMDGWRLKVRQGLVDRYAGLMELDKQLLDGNITSEENITRSAWARAKMSNAASGAVSAMMNAGRIFMNKDGIVDVKKDTNGLIYTLNKLGSSAEIERFMGWIAGNRGEKLMAEGRENLFTPEDIQALKGLNRGELKDGGNRNALYEKVFKEFQQYRDDVLAIAEESGIITSENREMWANEFYVPFYRLNEDNDDTTGPRVMGGLSRQQAYKKLKGGTQNLNDLLQNTLMNFHHLVDASMKNMAAKQGIDNAVELGAAEKTVEAARDKKQSTFILRNGVKEWYDISDPMVYSSLTSLNHTGMNGYAMSAMRWFKRTFTNLTTSTPQFVVANLLRDSMSAVAVTDMKKNAAGNIAQGLKSFGLLDRHGYERARLMASGGAFSFGHVYGEDADSIRYQIDGQMRRAKVIKDPKQLLNLGLKPLQAGWDRWMDVNNSLENVNRAAAFKQAEDAGKGTMYAAFQARDLMDFSAHGAWPAVRFLIDVVPFLNARLQGLDKLYRSGVKPSTKVVLRALGFGNVTQKLGLGDLETSADEKKAAARFSVVVGALSVATMTLFAHNQDDEEYRKAPDWLKDSYWWFRIPETDHVITIPKPFEVGAIATVTERLLEQGMDDEATGKLFRERIWHMLTGTFAFSAVPQMFQPALDVYANKDSFTERQIETMGQSRLSKSNRVNEGTTGAAKMLSKVTTGVFGEDSNYALSPVQMDFLIGGYLGQIGAWVSAIPDVVVRQFSDTDKPSVFLTEYQPIKRFYRDASRPAYTKDAELFYDSLRKADRLYADMRKYREEGDMEEYADTLRENRDLLGMRKMMNQVNRRLQEIRNRIKAIEKNGSLSAEEKRRQIDLLKLRRNHLIERVSPKLKAIDA